jgi:hypothetical protein
MERQMIGRLASVIFATCALMLVVAGTIYIGPSGPLDVGLFALVYGSLPALVLAVSFTAPRHDEAVSPIGCALYWVLCIVTSFGLNPGVFYLPAALALTAAVAARGLSAGQPSAT